MKVLLIVLFFVCNILAYAKENVVPAGPEVFECGQYEIKGRLVKKIDFDDYLFTLYHGTTRGYTIKIHGPLVRQYRMYRNHPVKLVVNVKKSAKGKFVVAKLKKFKGVVAFTQEFKNVVTKVKELACHFPNAN